MNQFRVSILRLLNPQFKQQRRKVRKKLKKVNQVIDCLVSFSRVAKNHQNLEEKSRRKKNKKRKRGITLMKVLLMCQPSISIAIQGVLRIYGKMLNKYHLEINKIEQNPLLLMESQSQSALLLDQALGSRNFLGVSLEDYHKILALMFLNFMSTQKSRIIEHICKLMDNLSVSPIPNR